MHYMYNPIPMFSQNLLFPKPLSVESELEGLKFLVIKKDEKIAQYEEEVNRLYEIIRELKRHRFGPRKERKFFDAWKSGGEKGFTLAEQGIKFYQRLYLIEKRASLLSRDERFELRKKEAIPIWNDFKEWADRHNAQVPPQSKIGQAFHSFLGEYPYLIGYLRDGHFEMDNGFVE